MNELFRRNARLCCELRLRACFNLSCRSAQGMNVTALVLHGDVDRVFLCLYLRIVHNQDHRAK